MKKSPNLHIDNLHKYSLFMADSYFLLLEYIYFLLLDIRMWDSQLHALLKSSVSLNIKTFCMQAEICRQTGFPSTFSKWLPSIEWSFIKFSDFCLWNYQFSIEMHEQYIKSKLLIDPFILWAVCLTITNLHNLFIIYWKTFIYLLIATMNVCFILTICLISYSILIFSCSITCEVLKIYNR